LFTVTHIILGLLVSTSSSQDSLPVVLADSGTTEPRSLAPTLSNVGFPPADFGEAYAPELPDTLGPEPLNPFREAADSSHRPRAIEYSNFYYTRLAIHRAASYATLPLFAAEFIVGRKLITQDTSASGSLRNWHSVLAGGIAGLFAINTVTGVWNLLEDRKNPEGLTRRTLHSLMMLTADAGFVVTGATAPHHRRNTPLPANYGRTHQAVAISSMGLALGSYLMMLIWKD
jgi:hypothetical protein